MAERRRSFDVLVVDDNAVDAELAEMVLGRLATTCRTHLASDGDLALAFLRREGAHADAPRPDLVLLDIKMPRVGGLEVLCAVKSDPALSSIPVVMLTSSGDRKDIGEAYRAHANGYVVKPVGMDEFEQAIAALEAYWFATVCLPAA